MGAWDTGIFDDDIAMDIKAEFEDAIEEGMTVKKATKQILESFEDVLEDEEEASVVYLALAALQLESGTVQSNIKKKALKIIESGQELDRWKDSGEAELNNRKKALNELKEKLLK